MELSIIIVNWNSKEFLRKCVSSILAETHDLEFEIIVVDSASFDGCDEMLRNEYPQIRFIQCRENVGFAKSNNIGFQSARGEFIFFLNPDTEIVGTAINALIAAIKGLPEAGAVGCKLLNTDGSLQTSCVQAFPTILNQFLNAEALRRLTPKARLWGMEAIFENSRTPAAVDMISGACLLMRRSVFEQIGKFSTDYFMYAEDADLCYKCRKCGFANYYCGRAVVVHHGGGSSQQARGNFSHIMMIESINQFFDKWRGGVYGGCYRSVLSGAALIRVSLLLILSPLLLVKSGVTRWKASCSKWFAVINWGLGLSRWVRQYQKTEKTTRG